MLSRFNGADAGRVILKTQWLCPRKLSWALFAV